MLKTGLTGGIASGKSSAGFLFKKCGARYIDADTVSREVVAPGCEGWRRVVDAFGREILQQDGSLNRGLLGEMVFSDARSREMLNSILHPLILEKIDADIALISRRDPAGILVVEIALLIECGLQKKFDKLVVITARRDVQKSRLTHRDHFTESEAEARLASQMPLSDKAVCADYVIENNGTKQDLEKKVRKVYDLLEKDTALNQSG